jgi:hypothetical protein
MSLLNKIQGNPTVETQSAPSNSDLSQKEIEFILSTLRDGTFKGSQVVELYNVVLKLQQQHKRQAT